MGRRRRWSGAGQSHQHDSEHHRPHNHFKPSKLHTSFGYEAGILLELVKIMAAATAQNHNDSVIPGVDIAFTSNTTMETLEPFMVVAFIIKCNLGERITNGPQTF